MHLYLVYQLELLVCDKLRTCALVFYFFDFFLNFFCSFQIWSNPKFDQLIVVENVLEMASKARGNDPISINFFFRPCPNHLDIIPYLVFDIRRQCAEVFHCFDFFWISVAEDNLAVQAPSIYACNELQPSDCSCRRNLRPGSGRSVGGLVPLADWLAFFFPDAMRGTGASKRALPQASTTSQPSY